jgi:CheY-like chemotaxis protein
VIGIVRGHKGAIGVESKKGAGTTFTVLFPATTKEVQQAEPLEPAGEAGLCDGTVLVVDDEELILDVTKRILEKAGYTVLTARNGFEGIETFKAHHENLILVLMDMTMPGLSGVETFHTMAELDASVPVVLTSGFNESEASTQFGGNPPSGFIQKPYRGSELLIRLRNVFQSAALSDSAATPR